MNCACAVGAGGSFQTVELEEGRHSGAEQPCEKGGLLTEARISMLAASSCFWYACGNWVSLLSRSSLSLLYCLPSTRVTSSMVRSTDVKAALTLSVVVKSWMSLWEESWSLCSGMEMLHHPAPNCFHYPILFQSTILRQNFCKPAAYMFYRQL